MSKPLKTKFGNVKKKTLHFMLTFHSFRVLAYSVLMEEKSVCATVVTEMQCKELIIGERRFASCFRKISRLNQMLKRWGNWYALVRPGTLTHSFLAIALYSSAAGVRKRSSPVSLTLEVVVSRAGYGYLGLFTKW